MVDFLIQANLSNLVVATILAIIAWVVQRRVRSASLANLLWALVLIKMVTPPLFSLPVLEVPSVSSLSDGRAEVSAELASPTGPGASGLNDDLDDSANLAVPVNDASQQSASAKFGATMVQLALVLWLVTSTILLLLSAFRIIRFHGLLKANSCIDHELSQGLSTDVARQLGLRRHPNIVVTAANIAPFVWWMAGRSVIVVSKQAKQKLNSKDFRLVVTHEMAHLKRRDHWFRWLEWIALLGLWWNPVMWWARKQLRISEEMACDDLVLETATSEKHQYANSLLNMAELLTASAIRPPVVASAINSGGSLEKRLKMIIAEKTWKIPLALRMVIVAVAACVFPLGVVYAQDFEAVERRLGGGVADGELSLEQAGIMLEALKRSVRSVSGDREMEVKKQRYMGFMREIEAAVRAGNISKEDAEKKLIEVRAEMFRGGARPKARGDDSDNREMEAKKRRYEEFTREIEASVKAGRMSKEDAEKKMIEVRAEMFRGGAKPKARGDDSDNREMEAKKQRYEELAREIESAVKAGKLSKEDAEKKMTEMRKEMFRDGRKQKARGKDSGDREMEAKKRRYEEFTREIESAVKKGKMSKKDAEKKLNSARRKMFGDGD